MRSAIPQRITSFEGPFRYLSNFWRCAIPIAWSGESFLTLEHAYQWTKMDDAAGRAAVLAQADPGAAKHAARQHAARVDWDDIKVEVMRDLLGLKFQDRQLVDWLLVTGNAELVEGNTWGDTFWGVCRGTGQNMLGKLLMETRDKLRKHYNIHT